MYSSVIRAITTPLVFSSALFFPELALAAAGGAQDFTLHWVGIISLILFILAYSLVIGEEALHMRKSMPVMVAAGIIWVLTAYAYAQQGDAHFAEQAIRHNLLEYAELFLFLLAAMTYINTMDDRGVFNVLRVWLVSRGFTLRQIFWLTGVLAFFISPVADNLTTALLMVTVVLAIGKENRPFVVVACINVVVAANAGGAFSPFGDITTLMVWQKGIVHFQEFFVLFVPSLVNWIIPAVIMSFSVPSDKPGSIHEKAYLRHGALFVVSLFIFTVTLAVSVHNFLHLPPVVGMMTGLGLLKFYGYYLNHLDRQRMIALNKPPVFKRSRDGAFGVAPGHAMDGGEQIHVSVNHPDGVSHYRKKGFNIFKLLEHAEWDTLMFFYGIILCVGGLSALGYLGVMSHYLYGGLGATGANILVGVLSAIVDNIPVMFAVLSMMPDMSHGQWLLVTLTAGVGGSMLSVGSAAGVAVMGQARGIYTFIAHLRWSWAIALGYAASIWVHFLINSDSFS
jgi:Na+/H+ antiporter NhaD/arsenite permease-like protein